MNGSDSLAPEDTVILPLGPPPGSFLPPNASPWLISAIEYATSRRAASV